MIRDVVFLVADDAMRQLLCGFPERPHCHRSLGCGTFAFDEREGLGGGGVHTMGGGKP